VFVVLVGYLAFLAIKSSALMSKFRRPVRPPTPPPANASTSSNPRRNGLTWKLWFNYIDQILLYATSHCR